MHKDLKFRALKTAFDNARFAPDPLDRVAQFLAQMREAEAAHIAQLDAFELRPQPLTGIQVRRIGREALDMEPLPGSIREELCDHAAARNRCPIPDDHQMARDFPQQMLQEGHDIGRVDRPFLAVNIQLPRGGDGTDGREVVTRPPLPENRGLAYRSIGADDTGQGIEPRFIEEEDGLPLDLCPFLSAGQVSSRQRVMAVSSRWRARRAGFCRLQRMAWRRRLTWLGW